MQDRSSTSTIDRPVRGAERLTHVDALRGVALLGILLVNLLAFSGPSFLHVRPLSWWAGADRWVEWSVLILAEGAFYTIFSVLFGWGFGRWMRTRGAASQARFARRLGWLLAFGLVHLFGIWTGDILTHYALIGFLLLPFAGATAGRTAAWGAGLWAVGILLFATASSEPRSAAVDRWVSLYQTGTLGEVLQVRAGQGLETIASVFAYLPLILGFFLLGAALAKSRAFELAGESEAARRWWTVAAMVALPLGLMSKAVYGARLLGGGETMRLVLSTAVGGPALGFGYLALLTLWLTAAQRSRLAIEIQRSLAAAGRMALTVYLTQSVAMTMLYYGYGLGWYGRVGPASGIPIALVLFALQVIVAQWWLARFRFGPAEWLWRSLTYGRMQPWRRDR